MNQNQKISYFKRQIEIHLKIAFRPEILLLWNKTTVRYTDWENACRSQGHCLVIPIDVEVSIEPQTPWQVPFSGSKLTLWNPLPLPNGAGWRTWPESGPALWYLHETGTVMPAWNLFNTLNDLFTLREEHELPQRDEHGRFPSCKSPRYRAGLLRVPIFNETVAALVGACAGIVNGEPPGLDVKKLLLPPAIVLSHDCDILRGNDLITQLIRTYRFFSPMKRGKLPSLLQLFWVAMNAIWPRKYYFDNLQGMIDVERQFGYRSVFYFLNGNGGRFGARSGGAIIDDATRLIPVGWEVGMHYNYDTYLENSRFTWQRNELQRITGREILSGRAHYLRFDPERSIDFLGAQGIKFDESVGYSDFSGYRAGIAGVYESWGGQDGAKLLELPLVFMDSTLAKEEAREDRKVFRTMLTHLEKIGGIISILIHPGSFYNPEFPEMIGLYAQILNEVYHRRWRCFTPGELLGWNL